MQRIELSIFLIFVQIREILNWNELGLDLEVEKVLKVELWEKLGLHIKFCLKPSADKDLICNKGIALSIALRLMS